MNPELSVTDTLISSINDSSPSVSALTLAYARLHIRSLGTSDDTLIQVYINAAASYFEEQTGRQILTATREAWLDAFPFVGASGGNARIELPKPPLQSVTTVKYIDTSGVLQSYRGGSPIADLFTISAPAGAYARRGFVEPVYGGVWPIARAQTGAVRIRYICGYGNTMDTVPPLIRGVLCYLVAHFDTFRSGTQEEAVAAIPYGVQMMLDGFKYSSYPSQVLRQRSVIPSGTGWL